MTTRPISTPNAPKPVAAYAQGIVAGGFLFTAGQVGLDPATGALVEGGLEAQTQRALDNIRAVVTAAGLSIADIVKVTLYLTDMSKFPAVNALYERFLEGHRPVRTTVGVSSLPGGSLVEVDAIATMPGH